MSIIAPDSDVTLYAGVDNSDKKRLVFSSLANQRSYFASKTFRTKVGCTYCNGNAGDPLILELPMSDMYSFNYLSFKNKAFENKEIYAKALPPIYINNEVMAVPYIIDRFQTFMFDYDMDECSIVRETLSVTEKNLEESMPFSTGNSSQDFFYTNEPLSYDKQLQELLDQGVTVNGYGNSGKTSYLHQLIDWSKKGTNDYHAPAIFVSVSQLLESDTTGAVTPKLDDSIRFATCCATFMFDLTDGFPLINQTVDDQVTFTDLKGLLDDYSTAQAVSSILGMWLLPKAFCYDGSLGTSEAVEIQCPSNNLFSAKLQRFPYEYLRVSDFLGNVKEFKIEDFTVNGNVSKGGIRTCQFYVNYIFNGYPQLVLAPVGTYKYSSAGIVNFEECMTITDFPQIGFNTDGFLTWLGNVYRGQVVKSSTASKWKYSAGAFMAKEGASVAGAALAGAGAGATIGSVVPGLGTAAGAGIGALIGGGAAELSSAFKGSAFGKEMQLNDAAHKTLGDLAEPVDVPDFLQDVAPAYANDEYHSGGSTQGLVAYTFNALALKFDIVKIKTSILAKYNDLFKNYGYAKNNFNKPNVYHYIHGVASSGPNFNTDGVAYCKTLDCSVHGVDYETEKEIEEIFNKGSWFLKGD